MSRTWSIPLTFCLSGLLLIVVWSSAQRTSLAGEIVSIDNPANGSAPDSHDFWDTFTFGVDDWISSAPANTVLATVSYNSQTYPALVATQYGQGKAVYAPGSLFSEIDNLTSPYNVRHEIFIHSVEWVTNDQVPAHTRVLVTYGHRELVTYGGSGANCCTSNIVRALEDAGYTVEITSDIPTTLSRYGAVIMPGVGWYDTPGYPDPMYWSGDAGHAPTPVEVATLLDFVQNGGGLIASVEVYQGAAWMNPIGMPMSVTFGSICDARGLQGSRVTDHGILAKHGIHIYLPLVIR